MRNYKIELCERRNHGTTAAELPVALWLIIAISFPLLILATTSLRFALFWNASREAAQRAASCQTVQFDSPVGPSSVNSADLWAQKATAAFGGFQLSEPAKVYIVETDVNSGTTITHPSRTKLASVADIENKIYEIQVELNGQVDPIVTFPGIQGMVNIPGLTGPYPVTVRSQYSCEVPQGLNR